MQHVSPATLFGTLVQRGLARHELKDLHGLVGLLGVCHRGSGGLGLGRGVGLCCGAKLLGLVVCGVQASPFLGADRGGPCARSGNRRRALSKATALCALLGDWDGRAAHASGERRVEPAVLDLQERPKVARVLVVEADKERIADEKRVTNVVSRTEVALSAGGGAWLGKGEPTEQCRLWRRGRQPAADAHTT